MRLDRAICQLLLYGTKETKATKATWRPLLLLPGFRYWDFFPGHGNSWLSNKRSSEFSTRDRTVFDLDNLFLIGSTTLSSLSKTSRFLN